MKKNKGERKKKKKKENERGLERGRRKGERRQGETVEIKWQENEYPFYTSFGDIFIIKE